MAKWIGTFDGETATHTVLIEHGYWKGNATVWIDGEVLFDRRYKVTDFGLDAEFHLDGVSGRVRIWPLPWFTFRYQLLVGDSEIQLFNHRSIKKAKETEALPP